MPQIFPKAVNYYFRFALVALPMLGGATGIGLAAFFRSTYATGVLEVVPQPVAFSHAHHSGQLGIDCRYCHNTVEVSGFANIPPTKTCVNCHQQMWTGSSMLAPVRESWKTDMPIPWNRVHNVPHFAYFNHSIHVAKGVGCASCHGRVDEMNLLYQDKTLLMEWCIDCHREPEKNLRPNSEVFNPAWTVAAGGKWKPEDFGFYGKTADGKDHPALSDPAVYDAEKKEFRDRPTSQRDLGLFLKDKYNVRDQATLTGCSICHR